MNSHRLKALTFAIALGLGGTTSASAAGCPAGTICAADPQSVVSAIQDAGYRAKLGKMESNGNPFIASSAGGYDFDVQFNNCTDNKDCESLMFIISFNNDDGANTIDLANKWNEGHRFSAMSLNDDKWLNVSYDVTTVGGLSKDNMGSVLDWWASVLGDLRTFFNESSASNRK